MRYPFLVESCLLSHGLKSVTNETLVAAWPRALPYITWVENGKILVGPAEQFAEFRASGKADARLDCNALASALETGASGALTASGTMAVCARLGVPLAVTCGMGGIGDIAGEELCPDLPALRDIPVALLATAPKDVVDIPATLQWLTQAGVRLIGADAARCTGYIFRSADVPLPQTLSETPHPLAGKTLILNGIPEAERIADPALLARGIAQGHRAEREGRYFHPAANGEFDRLTGGRSSEIQLYSIIENARLAAALTGDWAATDRQ